MNCNDCKRESASPEESCPYRMQDGRGFTDYHTRCSQNQFLMQRAQLPSSYDYRMYLTQNALTLMDEQRHKSYTDNKCVPCYDVNESGTMLPEQSKVQCDGRVCQTTPGNQAGLGQGRDYRFPQNGSLKDFAPAHVTGASAFYPIGGNETDTHSPFGAPM